MSQLKKTRVTTGYLCVSTHDFASLLVERLTVPVWVYLLQGTSQSVMFPQEECVHGGEGDVLIYADVTYQKEKRCSNNMTVDVSENLKDSMVS